MKRHELLKQISEQNSKYVDWALEITAANSTDLMLELDPQLSSRRHPFAAKVASVVSLETNQDLPKKYDIISCWGALRHWTNPSERLTDASKLLANNGQLIFATGFYDQAVLPFWTAIYGIRDLCYVPPKKTLRHNTLQEILSILDDTPFEVENIKIGLHYEDLDSWIEDMNKFENVDQVIEKLSSFFANLAPDWLETMNVKRYEDIEKYYFTRYFLIACCKIK
jgi:hypothetical protein